MSKPADFLHKKEKIRFSVLFSLPFFCFVVPLRRFWVKKSFYCTTFYLSIRGFALQMTPQITLYQLLTHPSCRIYSLPNPFPKDIPIK